MGEVLRHMERKMTDTLASSESDTQTEVGTAVALIVIVMYSVAAAFIEARHVQYVHESVVAIALGAALGALSVWGFDGEPGDIPSSLWKYVIPPMIFAEGYTLRRRRFFYNINVIMTFGLGATLLNFVLLLFGLLGVARLDVVRQLDARIASLDLNSVLLLAAILCPTDTVAVVTLFQGSDKHKQLKSIMFGEGVINDAISIALFGSILKVVQSGDSLETGVLCGRVSVALVKLVSLSTLIGIGVGLVSALCFKLIHSLGHHFHVHELAVILSFGYASYEVAELAELSGIVSIFFAGLTMAHYNFKDMRPEARVSTITVLKTISFLAEAYGFAYVGMSAVDSANDVEFSVALIVILVSLVCASRLLSIGALAVLCWPLVGTKLKSTEIFVVAASGVVRGAIAFALAGGTYGVPHYDLIMGSTIGVVAFTTIVLGSLMKPLIKSLLRHRRSRGRRRNRKRRGDGVVGAGSSSLTSGKHRGGVSPSLSRGSRAHSEGSDSGSSFASSGSTWTSFGIPTIGYGLSWRGPLDDDEESIISAAGSGQGSPRFGGYTHGMSAANTDLDVTKSSPLLLGGGEGGHEDDPNFIFAPRAPRSVSSVHSAPSAAGRSRGSNESSDRGSGSTGGRSGRSGASMASAISHNSVEAERTVAGQIFNAMDEAILQPVFSTGSNREATVL